MTRQDNETLQQQVDRLELSVQALGESQEASIAITMKALKAFNDMAKRMMKESEGDSWKTQVDYQDGH